MPTPEIRKFDGLYLQPNSFDVPDGAMEVAQNVVLQSDNVISKTKGFYEYWRPSGFDVLDRLVALYTYQGQLIGAFDNGIGYFDDTYPFGDTYNSVGALTRISGEATVFENQAYFAEANQNIYITGTRGVFRLEAYSGPERKVGVPPGLSLSVLDSYETVGVLPPDSQTAYRVVFGRRDANGNLLLSAPSDVATIGVPAPVLLMSYAIVAGVVTVQDPDEVFAERDGQSILVSAATDALLNGQRTLLAPLVSTAIRFATAQPDSIGTLTVTVSAMPTVTAQIPSEIDDVTEEWFAQFYRTLPSDTVAGSPFDQFFLVNEQNLTAIDLATGEVSYTDRVDAELFGAELYTNPNTREGPGQANTRPPLAAVIGTYKGHMLYSDVQTVQRLRLDMVNIVALNSNDLSFQSDFTLEVYAADTGNYAQKTSVTGAGTGTIVITDGSNDPAIGDRFLITAVTGTLPASICTITAVAYPTYTIVAPGLTMSAATVEFLTSGSKFVYDNIIFIGMTDAQNVQRTATSLVTSINRNSSLMYANYLSAFDDFPGRIGLQSKAIIPTIFVKQEILPPDPAFIQNLPTSFSSGVQFYSENDALKNATYISKVGEPEAVPPLNRLFAGNVNSRTLATFDLRDCCILIKEDGAFKMTGDSTADFQITPLDTTVKFPRCPRVAGTINNVVIAISNQGVVQVTENSVQVISRRIDDVIQPLVGLPYDTTFLQGNEGDRLFYVNTSRVNAQSSGDDVCWVYNVINQTWTESMTIYQAQGIGPKDETCRVVFDEVVGDRVIMRQRKTQTLVDYTAGYCVGTITIAADKLSGTIIITGGNAVFPAVGDVILYNDVFTRITVATAGGGGYELVFAHGTNIPAVGTPTVTVYKAYRSLVKMAPFHAGQVSLMKHFSQLQIHLRQPAISDLRITFGGAYFSSSEITDWSLSNFSSEGSVGWGFSPWGFFPWGLDDSTDLVAGTRAASIIRTNVPRFAARNALLWSDPRSRP